MDDNRTSPEPAESSLDFVTLLQRCADKAYNFAFRLTGNDPDAQDLVQEAFARAFEHNKDRYDPKRPLAAWVHRILHNIFLDNVRRYEHKHSVSLDNRSAVILYDIEGLSYDDIVNIMRCPLGTVCSRIFKGRQLLKEALQTLDEGKEVTANE